MDDLDVKKMRSVEVSIRRKSLDQVAIWRTSRKGVENRRGVDDEHSGTVPASAHGGHYVIRANSTMPAQGLGQHLSDGRLFGHPYDLREKIIRQ